MRFFFMFDIHRCLSLFPLSLFFSLLILLLSLLFVFFNFAHLSGGCLLYCFFLAEREYHGSPCAFPLYFLFSLFVCVCVCVCTCPTLVLFTYSPCTLQGQVPMYIYPQRAFFSSSAIFFSPNRRLWIIVPRDLRFYFQAAKIVFTRGFFFFLWFSIEEGRFFCSIPVWGVTEHVMLTFRNGILFFLYFVYSCVPTFCYFWKILGLVCFWGPFELPLQWQHLCGCAAKSGWKGITYSFFLFCTTHTHTHRHSLSPPLPLCDFQHPKPILPIFPTISNFQPWPWPWPWPLLQPAN